VREFVRILKLHHDYPAEVVGQAIGQALEYGCAHADGVQPCLRQLMHPGSSVAPMDLTRWPQLVGVGTQVPDLHGYDQLLKRV
jgi:hypothetical protein